MPPSSWRTPPGEGGPRGQYGEPKLINPEGAMESARNREAEILTTDYTDERGSGTFQMRNGELIPPSPLPSPPGEGVLRAANRGSGGNRAGRGGSGRSRQVNQHDPITSDHIRPNPTKSDQKTGPAPIKAQAAGSKLARTHLEWD